MFRTGTNRNLLDGSDGNLAFVEAILFLSPKMENHFGKHLHLVSPFPLRCMKHPEWNVAWFPGCLVAPPVLKVGRIAFSKYKTGWSQARRSEKPALMYK